MKVIFKCVTGSHLYGLNTPESDEDYLGVFVPSLEQYLGLENPPVEVSQSDKKSDGARNTKGDVDCKLISLKSFLRFCGQGQSMMLEMLFVPENQILEKTPEWDIILENKHLLLSRKGVAPFLGFARAQAHKAVIKGENLRLITKLIKDINNYDRSWRAADLITEDSTLCGNPVKTYVNDHGFKQLHIAGRDYDVNIKLKTLQDNLKQLAGRYGTRVQAAAEDFYDYKSLLHAMRQISEAEEFLATGHITLPRPEPENSFLMSIRRKEWPDPDFDLFRHMNDKIDHIQQVLDLESPLPKAPNWSKINDLCIKITKLVLNC